ncbi:hypothetical protein BGZ63DRAFT_225762 [Mariannaea sp. PMI_226]|nr:hypothetical protein BGZ63DRAFT_225762 [Mariannaea sp. PMI_226]
MSSSSSSRYSHFTIPVGLVVGAFAAPFLLTFIIISLSQAVWDHDVNPPMDRSNLKLHRSAAHPVPCSSHNDYWREMPLHSALEVGCIGVEADVWPFQGQLYVSHNRDRLVTDRTLTSLYIDPLVKILQGNNHEVAGHSQPARGVYDLDPTQSLVLLVDIKTNPTASWPLLVQQLEPLRAAGWLSRNSNGTFLPGPITVVASGTAKVQDVESNLSRDIFLDAPLAALDDGAYNNENSYYASISFRKSIGWAWFGTLRQSQLTKIRDHIGKAHTRGLKVRYWSLPAWPLAFRKNLWNLLVDEGLDILHVDDLRGARDILDRR